MHAKAHTIRVSLLIETLKKSHCLSSHDPSGAFETFWFRGLVPSKTKTMSAIQVGAIKHASHHKNENWKIKQVQLCVKCDNVRSTLKYQHKWEHEINMLLWICTALRACCGMLPFIYPDKSSDEVEPWCNDMIEPHPPNLSLAQPKYTSLIPNQRKWNN